ncbi:uncharacterized protein LOC135366447 isoform X1 [Ornithodoros turicata]|uniref:uncharacterized protein LOC135366447 isoform X1 n=1 Tax=Ornithodoros turicata TaxID=34597 RepID=UPI003138E0B8
MFSCRQCGTSFSSRASYVTHQKVHININNYRFPCFELGCQVTFSTYSAFSHHCKRSHTGDKRCENDDSVFPCRAPFCGIPCSRQNVSSHLREHVSNGQDVVCPYPECKDKPTMRSRNAVSVHMTRYHGKIRSLNSKQHAIADDEASTSVCTDDSEDVECHLNLSTCEDVLMGRMDDSEGCSSRSTSEGMVTEIKEADLIARLILQATTKLHVPSTTMTKVLSDVASIVEIKMDEIKRKVSDRFENSTSSDLHGVKEAVLSDLEQSLPFASCRESGELSSQHLQAKYFKEHFQFFEPVEISLKSVCRTEQGVIHYMPLTLTLPRLLRDASVIAQLKDFNVSNEASESFADFTDGSLFKASGACSSKSDLHLMFYQDAFEVVNPIGSAKQKHKVLGVYFTLGNLKQHNRSKVDQLQLALFCTEKNLKKFGQEKVFGRLVTDLKQLVASGLTIGSMHYTFSLSSILGDNLGSHQIGGFLESFSCEYFCRFCLVTREEFHSCPTTCGESRTEENYTECVSHLANEGSTNHKGIKLNSIFNTIPGYHVCRGLPPCLGHDVFEGVVSYDTSLFLRYFQSKGWFSVRLLNSRLEKLRLLGHDGADKPPALKEGLKTLGGHAAQNWALLRFLPLLLADAVVPTDAVWKLFLLLRDIVNLVSARKISLTQILYLKELIELYLELITELFPTYTLKPKHHFLLHYPELILKYGPLIWLWTMRFESKHSYSKKVARVSNNFVNLTLTLARKHELLQCYLSTGTMFPPEVIVTSNSASEKQSFPEKYVQLCRATLCQPFELFRAVQFRGTSYIAGYYVAWRREESTVIFARLEAAALCEDTSLFLIISEAHSSYLDDLGIYAVEGIADTTPVQCVNITDIVDYYPLPLYSCLNRKVLVLKHSIFDDYSTTALMLQ